MELSGNFSKTGNIFVLFTNAPLRVKEPIFSELKGKLASDGDINKILPPLFLL